MEKLLQENSASQTACHQHPAKSDRYDDAKRKIRSSGRAKIKNISFFVIFDDIYDQITFGGRKHF